MEHPQVLVYPHHWMLSGYPPIGNVTQIHGVSVGGSK